MKSYKDIIIEMLTVINYSGDKNQYAAEAEQAVFAEALVNMKDKLPDDMKQQVEASKTDFREFTDEDRAKAQQYLNGLDYVKDVERLYKKDIKDFFEELKPTLDADQKQQLEAIIKSFEEQPPIVSQQTASAPVVSDTTVVLPTAPVTPQENPTQ